jgi:hypothetical protein
MSKSDAYATFLVLNSSRIALLLNDEMIQLADQIACPVIQALT